jgi:DNA-binding NarL/FixJ family response regulator
MSRLMRRRVRLFHADNHDLLRRGVRALVAANGDYQMAGWARNGSDARRLVAEIKPDIAILDFSLPDLNALDLTHALKHASPQTEVLIYTTHYDEDVVRAALEAGIRAFVPKSEPADCLIAALDALAVGRSYFSPVIVDVLLNCVLGEQPLKSAEKLTIRKRDVVKFIAEGWLNRQIASELNVSLKIVESHRSQAMHKVRARTTTDLVRWAIKHDLVEA